MLHYSKPCSKAVADHFTQTNDPLRSSIAYLQDVVHSALKFRNRLLTPGIIMPMGNKVASVAHLKMLLHKVGKGDHGLVMKDVCADDRQNYDALKKIMKPEVSKALAKHVVDSQATIMFLKLCCEISSSLYENNLSPLERIYRIWHANFFLRAWRKWLQKADLFAGENKRYNLTDNFLTRNCYACVEINASNLISIVQTFRDKNLQNMFLPTLFNSQPCEEYFRQLRSMGTINFTKINFTLLQVFHLVSRVELLNECIYFKLKNFDVCFPRNKINDVDLNQFVLPSDNDIKCSIKRAEIDALADAAQLGMLVNSDEVQHCELENVDVFTNKRKRSCRENEDEVYKDFLNEKFPECTNLQSYSNEKLQSSNAFIEIMLENGEKKVLRTSTLLWLLTESNGILSNDRLRRVQGAKQPKKCCRRLQFDPIIEPSTKSLIVQEEIKVGDWCIFHKDSDMSGENEFCLGNVLCFQYINGKNAKDKQYTWDFVPVKPPERDNVMNKGIQVLASWYRLSSVEQLEPISSVNNFYINIENYVVTLSHSPFDLNENEMNKIDKAYFKIIKNYATFD